MKPFTKSPPFLTYASMTWQLTQPLLIALTFLAGMSQAQAEISLDELKSSIALDGSAVPPTRHIWGTDSSDFVDPAYAKWAWNNLKNFEDLSNELAKHEDAYKAWEKTSETAYKQGVKAAVKNVPFLKRGKVEEAFRVESDKKVFLASDQQEAIAKYRDLELMRLSWNTSFEQDVPFDAEHWRAFETFHCERNTKRYNFRMEDCRIPNWRRPDLDPFFKTTYERRKAEGTLKYLQTN
ncbi:hypothetical protein [Pseudovibrio brasiliensis]|uniref:Lysozyme inhibitor LprI N-terminal domain-containing protein n=1 Tax=Pseudovibrio brasiliensis TaxID=1898042 RepID=A0ABX8AWP6_9HYPH|nr:hypothetical protein [Pseudovibrio brasiliensis]QUS59115.1 hypothetical protein KGB56_26710 [Pseudovibrio brasiliensis]